MRIWCFVSFGFAVATFHLVDPHNSSRDHKYPMTCVTLAWNLRLGKRRNIVSLLRYGFVNVRYGSEYCSMWSTRLCLHLFLGISCRKSVMSFARSNMAKLCLPKHMVLDKIALDDIRHYCNTLGILLIHLILHQELYL